MNSFRNIYNSNLSHRAKSVYMYLKDRADSEGRCWPAIRTIALELGLSRSIATVDFVHFQSGEQQFFTDHEKLESFRSDLVVAEAMERLYQQLNQPDIGIRMGEM